MIGADIGAVLRGRQVVLVIQAQNIASGTEPAPGAGDDQHTDRLVEIHVPDYRADLADHAFVEGVELVRPVERQQTDIAFDDLEGDRLEAVRMVLRDDRQVRVVGVLRQRTERLALFVREPPGDVLQVVPVAQFLRQVGAVLLGDIALFLQECMRGAATVNRCGHGNGLGRIEQFQMGTKTLREIYRDLDAVDVVWAPVEVNEDRLDGHPGIPWDAAKLPHCGHRQP